MPRRPSKKSKTANKPRKINRSDGKINKWNNRADVPMDEEDQFHASRDQILLHDEGEGIDEDIDEDEVFALQIDDEEEERESEAMEEDDTQPGDQAAAKTTKSKKKTNAKGKGQRKEEREDSFEDEDEDEETWGRGKAAYYSSNAAQIDSDDEEALHLEELEAKRLQARARDDMNDDDFGLEDSVEINLTGGSDVLEESTTPVAQPVLLDKSSIIRHLQKSDPESLALAGDWTDSATSLMKTKHKIEKMENGRGSENSFSLGMMHLHYQTLLTYTTTLAFYLHLRASQKYAQKPELLRSHPVMQQLLKLKQSLITLEDLSFAVSDAEDVGDEQEQEQLEEDDLMEDARQLWDKDGEDEEDVDLDELDDLLADARSIFNSNQGNHVQPTIISPPKKKRKTGSEIEKPQLPIFDLVEPEFVSSKSISSTAASTSADAFGEVTSLQHADAADKSARRKTLRFHTSRIESANARRSNARSNALGGDDDIPYRERKKEKEERLAREAKARVRTQGGADLDDTEPEPRKSDDGDGDEEMEDANGYYDLVKKQVKEKKERKKAEYEASRAERFVEEEVSDGPRSLTRAILANRGLTPHRSKSVRNPRVKKRISFAKAQRKVASQKAVYKGGINATGGRYEGEKTGISKVVKSVRLG